MCLFVGKRDESRRVKENNVKAEIKGNVNFGVRAFHEKMSYFFGEPSMCRMVRKTFE